MRFSWWLLDKLSRVLGVEERDAVLGDLEESGTAGGEALAHLMGLIVRRQTQAWRDWRPWLALIGIVGCVGWRLSSFSLWLSDKISFYSFAYWRTGTFPRDGLSTFHDVVALSCQSLALSFWSWTAGFVLGSLVSKPLPSLREPHEHIAPTLWVIAPCCFAVWVLAGGARHPASLFLFGGVPLLLEVTLLLLPAIWGAQMGSRYRTLTVSQTIVLTATVATMTVLATWTGGWSATALEILSGGTLHPRILWQARLASYAVMSLPVWYVVAMAVILHGRNGQRQDSTFS